MPKRPQFSLKTLFVITTLLAVPLGMFTSGNTTLFIVGYIASFVEAGAFWVICEADEKVPNSVWR